MPSALQTDTLQTPQGRSIAGMDFRKLPAMSPSLVFTEITPGGPLFDSPLILTLGKNLDGMTNDTRGGLGDFKEGLSQSRAPLALVVESMTMRLALKAVLVLSPYGGPAKVFEREADALRWMDVVLAP